MAENGSAVPGATLCVLTGPLAGSTAGIGPGRPLLIGREPGCGLRLPGLSVSRQHARIDLDDRGLRIERLSGVNGLYINGTACAEHPLGLWDMIGIGEHVLRIDSLSGGQPSAGRTAFRSEASLLACLLDIQRLLTTDAEDMVERSLDSLFLALPATRLSLFTVDAAGAVLQGHTVARGGLPTTSMSRGFVRHVLEAGRAILLDEQDLAVTAGWQTTMRRQSVQAAMGVPVRHGERTAAVLLCDNLEHPGTFNRTHLEVLTAVGRSLEHVFQRSELQRLARERIRAELELENAHAVQRTLLGRDPARAAGPWRWAARYLPAREVGGDYFDHGLDGDGISLIIADVSGKGAGAGIVVGMLRIAYKAICGEGMTPAELLLAIDRRLRGDLPAGMFFTALAIHLSPDGRLRWAGLGHPDGVVFRRAAVTCRLACSPGMFGVLPEAQLTARLVDHEARVEPGDRIFLCTDGLVEAMDAAGSQFGLEGGWDALARQAEAPPEQALEGVLAAIRAHAGDAEQADDIALIVGDYRP